MQMSLEKGFIASSPTPLFFWECLFLEGGGFIGRRFQYGLLARCAWTLFFLRRMQSDLGSFYGESKTMKKVFFFFFFLPRTLKVLLFPSTHYT